MLVGDINVYSHDARLISFLSNPILHTSSLGYGCDLDHYRARVPVTLIALHTMMTTRATSFLPVQRKRIVTPCCCGGLTLINPVREMLDRCELPHTAVRS